MFQSFEQLQKFGQDGLDATVSALGAFSKGSQVIATESADFARKSFETGTGAIEKLTGARSLETAMEIQANFMRGAYEELVSQSSKMGALYTSLAKETLKPFEAILPKPFVS